MRLFLGAWLFAAARGVPHTRAQTALWTATELCAEHTDKAACLTDCFCAWNTTKYANSVCVETTRSDACIPPAPALPARLATQNYSEYILSVINDNSTAITPELLCQLGTHPTVAYMPNRLLAAEHVHVDGHMPRHQTALWSITELCAEHTALTDCKKDCQCEWNTTKYANSVCIATTKKDACAPSESILPTRLVGQSFEDYVVDFLNDPTTVITPTLLRYLASSEGVACPGS